MSTATIQNKELRCADGQVILYTLARKRVKNINLHVRADGSVFVSAPIRAAERDIEQILQTRTDFIRNAQERLRAANREPQPDNEEGLRDGTVYFLAGERFVLRVMAGSRCGAQIIDGELRMTVCPEQDALEQKKQLMSAVLMNWSRVVMPAPFARTFERFRRECPTFPLKTLPNLKFREMISRWGSCIPVKASVTLNTRLILHSPACMEYVMVHELAHFVHPDHSPAFYAVLDRMLPDWRARRAELNGQRTEA